jgi:hypothetical protein
MKIQSDLISSSSRIFCWLAERQPMRHTSQRLRNQRDDKGCTVITHLSNNNQFSFCKSSRNFAYSTEFYL